MKANRQTALRAIDQLLEASIELSKRSGVGAQHRSKVLLAHAELAEKYCNEGDYDAAVTLLTHPERIVLC